MPFFRLFCNWSTLDTVYIVVDLAPGTPFAPLYGSVYGSTYGPGALTHQKILKNSFQNLFSSSVLFIVLYTVLLLPAELTPPLPAEAGLTG